MARRAQRAVGAGAAELDAFVARRLLDSDSDGDAPVVEVAHEEFLTAWPPLSAAITDRAAGLRARRDIELAAEEWAATGRPVNHLWEGARLATAMAATGADRPTSRSIALGPTSAKFLRASRRHDTFRRRRLVAVLSVLLVAALVAAGVAYVQGDTAPGWSGDPSGRRTPSWRLLPWAERCPAARGDDSARPDVRAGAVAAI